MWTVILRPRFLEWLDAQPDDLRARVYASIVLLEDSGPNLARPYADTLKGSKLNNLKELRIKHGGHPIRAFYVFDPVRRAVVLCAGDKTGKKRFYEEQIPIAETEYEQYLQECRTEEEN